MKKFTVPGLSSDDIAVLINIKDFKQYIATIEKLLNRECPFCQINTSLNQTLYENESWRIWINPFPQDHQELHLVIPHKKHLKHLSDLTQQDFINEFDIIQWACKNFDLPGGGYALRFGNADRHAGSVPNHLHYNIQIPDGTGSVRITLQKNPEEIAKKIEQLLVFEKLRTGTNYNDLSENERKSIEGRYT